MEVYPARGYDSQGPGGLTSSLENGIRSSNNLVHCELDLFGVLHAVADPLAVARPSMVASPV
jgi:hypothetical protein